MTAPPPSDPPLRFQPASDVTLRTVEWLWPGRLPLGHLSVLEGDPDLGKSWVALDLCARLSTGRPWPDGAPAPAPGASVFLSAEDSGETTLGPRLRALGADLARVFFPDRDDGLASVLSVPTQAGVLEEVVERTGARLVVIDPVSRYFGREVNMPSDQSVRRALASLGDLARRRACAVLLIRHLNKAEGRRALYRGLGSIGLAGICRSAWLVAESPEAPGRRVLAQQKGNLGPPQPSLAFEVVQPEGGAATLSWLGPAAVTAEGLVGSRRRHGPEPVKRKSAAVWLTELLASGPMKVRDIWERVLKEGLSPKTVRNARKDLGIRPRRTAEDGRQVTYWLLYGQRLPGEDKPDAGWDDLQRKLREVEEQYPPRTPLEDDDDF
jgi:hypothetical protein